MYFHYGVGKKNDDDDDNREVEKEKSQTGWVGHLYTTRIEYIRTFILFFFFTLL